MSAGAGAGWFFRRWWMGALIGLALGALIGEFVGGAIRERFRSLEHRVSVIEQRLDVQRTRARR